MGLTALKVARLTTPGRYGDGGGLWLQVSKWGTKSWLYRYALAGRGRSMGLGAAERVSLAEARELAQEARRQSRAGRDPIEGRRADRAQQALSVAAAMTFRQAALAAIAARESGWDNAEHRRQWNSTLETYVYPVMGPLPVGAIDTAIVLKAIEPIWSEKRTTAERVRGRIEAVLDWASARGYRSGDNPARWRGHLQHLLAKQSSAAPAHHAALPYPEVPAFLAMLRGRVGATARALEFTVLTAARSGEVLGARWSEIEGAVWTVPAKRMKARREHRVPLSESAMALLAGLPRVGDFVFLGVRGAGPLHAKAMAELLRSMGVATTVHGFRSSFRDWAAEQTAYPREICEQALAHAIPDKVEAAYRRSDLFEKRRRLMADWSKYCAKPMAAGDNVLPIHKSAKSKKLAGL